MLRVGIVDDHLLFRKSMVLLINSFDGMQVVVEAENGSQFLDQLKDLIIDVVLLDIQMPVMDGYETCKHLFARFPDVKILIVSQLTSRLSIHKMMELGAHGYFTKNANPEELELAIRSMHEEGFYFGHEVALRSIIKEVMLWQNDNQVEVVTPKKIFSKREIEIIRLICKEMKSQEIADQLFINIRTVESHRKHVMEKTSAKNFIGVILFALKNGILTIDEL